MSRKISEIKLDTEALLERDKIERKARRQARREKLSEYPNPLTQSKDYWQDDVFICGGKKFEVNDAGQTICTGKFEEETDEISDR